MIKVKRSPSVPPFVIGGVVEVAASASLQVRVCIVLVGTSEGLAGPRVLEGARCRCCGTE